MLANLSWGHLFALAVIGLIVFGPERLPAVAADVGRFVRRLRELAREATEDLATELGPEVAGMDLAAMHPRDVLQRYLFDDPAEEARTPTGRPGGAVLPAGEQPPFDPDAT
jgi:sec-independent protein translocase protein TatB